MKGINAKRWWPIKEKIFETLYFTSQYSFGAGNHKKNNVHL